MLLPLSESWKEFVVQMMQDVRLCGWVTVLEWPKEEAENAKAQA